MALRLRNITMDCTDPRRVASFWAAALDRQVDPEGTGAFCSIGNHVSHSATPAWLFIRVPEQKQAKNRVHLDLVASSRSTVDHLIALGATVVAEHEVAEHGRSWTVLHDPEDNEFCVSFSRP